MVCGLIVGVAEARAPVAEVGGDNEYTRWIGEVGREQSAVAALGGLGGATN